MSLTLDPLVQRKLDEFRRRRTTMLLTRGLCAGLIAFLLCMAIISFADWYWLLTEATRWCLTLAGYAAVVITLWFTCISKLIDSPDQEEIATQLESLQPNLRENLLSAVELATDDATAVNDSPQFRSILQSKVANQMGDVRVPKLLPFEILRAWLLTAVVLLLIAFLLVLFAGPKIRQLMTRAILPGANVARVSRVQIDVLQPTPQSLTIPSDETIAVVARVSGGSFNDVTLEILAPNKAVVRQMMRAGEDNQFAANLHVGNESIQYRICAGDAITEKFDIRSVARPHVLSFHKTFVFPEYSQLENKSVTEDSGDLIQLAGTTAELVLQLDQEVSAAELRVSSDDSQSTETIELIPTGDRQVSVLVPIEKAGIYKVHLVGKETQFESTFSPRYEIRPIADTIPRVAFVDQKETNLIVPPNDLLSLSGLAEDDMPLVSLKQSFSINGRRWRTQELEASPAEAEGKHLLTSQWKWDLLPLKLKSGDQVTTKLVATDRKGNVGESILLHIAIASVDFDPARHAVLKERSELFEELVEFEELANSINKTGQDVIKKLRKSNDQESAATLLELTARQREKADEVLERLQEVQQKMPRGADGYELELMGQVIARVQRDHLTEPTFLVAANVLVGDLKDSQNRRRDNLQRIKKDLEHTEHIANFLLHGYKLMLAHNMCGSVSTDMSSIYQQQKVVIDNSMDSWERLLRQQTVVIRQMDALEKLIKQHHSMMPDGIKNQLKDLRQWMERHRDKLLAESESEERFDQLKSAAQRLLRELEHKKNINADDISGGLANVCRDLRNGSDSLFLPLNLVGNAVRDNARLMQEIEEAQQSEDKKKQSEIARFSVDSKIKVVEIELRFRQSIEQLRLRRILNQARRDGDPRYAADAGLAHRAVITVLNHRLGGTSVDDFGTSVEVALREIAPAYRTLEAGHELTQARDNLRTLYANERWNAKNQMARLDNPRQWNVYAKGLETAVNRLRQSGASHEFTGGLERLRWCPAAQQANQKIDQRRWKHDKLVNASNEIQDLKLELESKVAQFGPTMDQARAVLRKYAPTITQMAENTAEQLRKLESKTLAAADDVERLKPKADEQESEKTKSPESQIAQLQRQQDAIAQQIEDLFDALVDEANNKDLLSKQQREEARDADDSIALIRKPADEMNNAMQEAQQNQSPQDQAEQLSNVAQQQGATAQALAQVAKHFKELEEMKEQAQVSAENPASESVAQSVAQSREQLRNAERAMGVQRHMDQQFEDTQKMAETSKNTAAQQMERLESELETNPAMQDALSEIAANAVEDAKSSLEAAARQEKNLQVEMERADKGGFGKSKKEAVKALKEIAQKTHRMANSKISHGRHFSQRGKSENAKKEFEKAKTELDELNQTANASNENMLLQELTEALKKSIDNLEDTADALEEARDLADKAKDEDIHNDKKRRESERKLVQNSLKHTRDQTLRNAEQMTRQKQQAKRQAEQQQHREENNLKFVQRNIETAEKQLEKNHDDRGAKNNLARSREQEKQQQAKIKVAKEQVAQAKKDEKQAQENVKRIAKMSIPDLKSKNPAAELAEKHAQEALKEVDDLLNKMEELKEGLERGDHPLAPSADRLAQAAQQQRAVKRDVDQVAQDLTRAARHEQRLKNEEASKSLESVALEIEKVAQGELESAQQQLAQAADASRDKETSEVEASKQATEAKDGLAKSESALAQQAKNLEPISGEQSVQQAGDAAGKDANQESDQGQQSRGSIPAARQSADEIEQATQMARALDELDRQLAQGKAQERSPSQAMATFLAEAAEKARAQMASERAQAKQMASQSAQPGEPSFEPGMESDQGAELYGDHGKILDVLARKQENFDDPQWGALRAKAADDLSTGRSEKVSQEYRKRVETYFRVLAEQSRESQ